MKIPRTLATNGPGGHIAALLAGAALPLAFAPFDFWPLAVLCPAVLLALLGQLAPRAAMLRGWCFGAGMFGVGTSWVYVSIHDYGAASVPLAALLTLTFCLGLALLPALGCWAWSRWLRARPGGTLLGFPAVWVLGEWCRVWLLSGFPWLYIGYSQIATPLAGWAPVTGVFGVGLILCFSSAVLVLVLRRAPGAPIAALACAVLWIAGLGLAKIAWVKPLGSEIAVAMVQGNIPQLLKWEAGHLQRTLDTYSGMSEELWGTALVVWPESAVPAYLDLVTDFLGEQATRAAANNSTLILGIPTRNASDADGRGYDAFNSLVALGADHGIYHKRHLVPFGEYVPLESWLRGLIAFFDLPMSSFSSGPEMQEPLAVQGLRAAPFICYEIVYPDLVRAALPQADLLLTVSNDTWFGASSGPLQHLQMARMRALENGRALIRATNNGVSALIDHHGHISVRGEQFTREVIRGSVQPMSGLTPFARRGSWPVLTFAALLIVLVGWQRPQRAGAAAIP
ncbi:MAG: apolipoprotein N-acyltransferase [Gammaproteobacteria bacterium]|nr:apolipoprotein N-acyltransferase [Gammaproteobacteria bacterium]